MKIRYHTSLELVSNIDAGRLWYTYAGNLEQLLRNNTQSDIFKIVMKNQDGILKICSNYPQ